MEKAALAKQVKMYKEAGLTKEAAELFLELRFLDGLYDTLEKDASLRGGALVKAAIPGLKWLTTLLMGGKKLPYFGEMASGFGGGGVTKGLLPWIASGISKLWGSGKAGKTGLIGAPLAAIAAYLGLSGGGEEPNFWERNPMAAPAIGVGLPAAALAAYGLSRGKKKKKEKGVDEDAMVATASDHALANTFADRVCELMNGEW